MVSEYIKVFKAFTDESRVRVLEILSEGEECACVLLDELEISQPTLSHHMKILCDSGIVRSRRSGKWNYYSINEEGCEYASRLLNDIVKKQRENITKIAIGFFRRVSVVRNMLRTCWHVMHRESGVAQTDAGNISVTCCCCDDKSESMQN